MTTLGPTAWLDVLADIGVQLQEVPRDNQDVYQQEVLKIVRASAAFEAVERQYNGSVWARFVNGPIVAIPYQLTSPPRATSSLNHPTQVAVPTETLTFIPPEMPLHKRETSDNLPGPVEMPTSNLVMAFSSTKSPEDSVFVEELRQWLIGSGYHPLDKPTPQTILKALRSMKDIEIGIFYWTTHSWIYNVSEEDPDKRGLVIITNKVIEANDFDSITQADYNPKPNTFSAKLYMVFAYDKDKSIYYHGITSEFVKYYMRFSTNSLVFFDSCASFYTDFMEVCKEKKASLYLGWTSFVRPDVAIPTARYLFGGLLGTSPVPPGQPFQRPFNFDAVFAGMQRKRKEGLGVDTSPPSELMFSRAPGKSGEFGILMPSLYWLLATPEELSIMGDFGKEHEHAKVTINGHPLAVKKNKSQDFWSDSHLITCDLSDWKGGGAVLVELNEHQGNWRWLTEWSGHIIYTREEIGEPPFKGTITLTTEFSFLLRADVQDRRVAPDTDPYLVDLQWQWVDVLNYRFHAEGRVEQMGASPTQGKRVFQFGTQHADLNRVANVGFGFEPAKKQLLLKVLPATFARYDAIKEESWIEEADGKTYPMAPRLESSIAFFPDDISDFIVIPLEKNLSSSSSHTKPTPRGSTDHIPISNAWKHRLEWHIDAKYTPDPAAPV